MSKFRSGQPVARMPSAGITNFRQASGFLVWRVLRIHTPPQISGNGIMHPTKRKAMFNFLAITTCIITVTAALLLTNAPAANRLTSPPVQLAAVETNAPAPPHPVSHKKNLRLASTCSAGDGSVTCRCAESMTSNCCHNAINCWCSSSACQY